MPETDDEPGLENDPEPAFPLVLDQDEDYPPPCIDPNGHSWVTADEDNGGDGRSYCQWCGADGDA